MSTKHSEKALKTLAELGTDGKDWLHPAVEWKELKLTVPGFVACPDCVYDYSSNYQRKAYYAVDETGTQTFEFPRDVDSVNSWGSTIKDCYYDSTFGPEFRKAYAEANPDKVVFADCRRCRRVAKPHHGRYAYEHSTGTIPAMVQKVFMVGFIQWPVGTQFGVSRFAGSSSRSTSVHQCELCAKGINQSNRVPLVTTKGGQPRAMFVGQDCARKFTGVMPLKLDKKLNPRGRDVVLADNIEAPELANG